MELQGHTNVQMLRNGEGVLQCILFSSNDYDSYQCKYCIKCN